MKKILFALLSTIMLAGCSLTDKNEYSKELDSIMDNTLNQEIKFFGTAEYGHTWKVTNITEKDQVKTYTIKGEFADNIGDDHRRDFEITYEVTEDKIIEKIINNDVLKTRSDTMLSIVKDQIILKEPLEVGNKWNQEFTYKDTEYIAYTEIIKIEILNGKNQYTTKLSVSNIDGFLNDTYKEYKTYEEGKGLIKFSYTFETGSDVQDGATEETYTFSFYRE